MEASLLSGFLNRSYPLSNRINGVILRALGFGLFVSVFLFAFKPFGLDAGDQVFMLKASLYFGLITTVSIIFNSAVLPLALPKLFNEEKWTVWKEIAFVIFNIFIIGTGNCFLLVGKGWFGGGFWDLFWTMQVNTLGIGIFPVTFLVFFEQNRLLKMHLKQASHWNNELSFHKEEEENTTGQVTLADESGREELTISISQLVWAVSDRNYLDLFLWQDGQLQRHLLRNRMKYLEGLLPADTFFRCHRSYIVNLDWVNSVEGNARGYELHIRDTEKTVPVSRQKIQEMESRLAKTNA